jgi:hypothetical protein
MIATTAALDAFDKFISTSKELAKLPQLVIPQYSACASDLYEISQKLLSANDNFVSLDVSDSIFQFSRSSSDAELL